MGISSRWVVLASAFAISCGSAPPTPQPLPPVRVAPVIASAASSAAPSPPPFVACSPEASSAAAESAAPPRQLVEGRHVRSVRRLVFSPTGRLLATGSQDGSIRVWDVATRATLRIVRKVNALSPVGWDGDGRIAFNHLHPDPVVLALDTGKEGDALADLGFPFELLRAPEGGAPKWVALVHRSARMLDARGHELSKVEVPAHEKLGFMGENLVISADAKHVAGLWAKDAIVARALAEGAAEQVVHFPGVEYLERVALAPDGARVVVQGSSNSWSYLQIAPVSATASPLPLPWPPSLGLQQAKGGSNGGGPPVSALAVSARLAAAATTKGAFVWDMETRALAWSRAVPPELGAPAKTPDSYESVAFSGDGKLVAFGSQSGRVFLYDAATGRLQGELGAKPRWPSALRFLGPKELVVASTDPGTQRSSLSRWSIEKASLLRSEPSGPVEAIGATEKGELAVLRSREDSVCAGQFVRDVAGVERAKSGICVKGSASVEPWLMKSELAPRAGVALVPVEINGFGVLDLRTAKLVRLEKTGTTSILLQSAALSPDGAHAVGYTTDAVYVYDARTGKQLHRLALAERLQTPDVPTAMAIAEDGKTFALAVPIFATGVTAIQRYALPSGKLLDATPLNGAVTALAFGESSSVLVVAGLGAERGSVVVLRDGKVVASSKADADYPFKVAVDPSHSIAATLSQDGAVRIWDLGTAALRGTLAEFDDGEWIVATPGGAYTGTDEVASRVGWVFDAPTERFEFDQFAASFRDPARVSERMRGGDADADSRVGRPPTAAILEAPSGLVTTPTATLRVRASSSTRVDAVRVFAEGRPVAERSVCAPSGEVSVEVPLLPGTNRVSAVAFDARGFASNEAVVDVVASRPDLPKPDVWVVAVGVGRYSRLPEEMQLGAATNDARGVAELFRKAEGATFGKAHVALLTDEQATPAHIVSALGELAQMRPSDIAVVLFAGHGVKPGKGADMVFLTGGVEVTADRRALTPESLGRDTVGWREISAAVAAAKGRVVVLLDACHSGHIHQELLVHNDALAGALVREGRAGAVVFAAAKGRQLSLEPGSARGLVLDTSARASVRFDEQSPHGFFTGALLGALVDGVADRNGDGAIQLSELIDDVYRRVTVASAGEQSPWVARRDLLGDFKVMDLPKASSP